MLDAVTIGNKTYEHIVLTMDDGARPMSSSKDRALLAPSEKNKVLRLTACEQSNEEDMNE